MKKVAGVEVDPEQLGRALQKVAGKLAKEGTIVSDDELVRRALATSATSAKRERKLKKWTGRASSQGQDWSSMDQRSRRIFKRAFRADRALGRLQKVLEARDAKLQKASQATSAAAGTEEREEVRIDPVTGRRVLVKLTVPSVLAKAAVDHRDMNEEAIRAANLARTRRDL